jgi:hypothetical protein
LKAVRAVIAVKAVVCLAGFINAGAVVPLLGNVVVLLAAVPDLHANHLVFQRAWDVEMALLLIDPATCTLI